MALEDLIAVLTRDVDAAFEHMTGYRSVELVGQSPRLLQRHRTSLAARRILSRPYVPDGARKGSPDQLP